MNGLAASSWNGTVPRYNGNYGSGYWNDQRTHDTPILRTSGTTSLRDLDTRSISKTIYSPAKVGLHIAAPV